MSAPTREEFAENVRRIIHGTVGPSSSDLAHSLLAAFDALAAERDAARAEVERLRTGVLAGTPPLVVTYRNWRGEVRERRITPRAVWFGSTHWHPERQWMLDATDEETGDLRTFAFAGFNPSDERIEAWRALDAATREEVIGSIIGDGAMHRDVHAIWAAGRCPLDLGPSDGPDPGYLSMAAACDVAALALEALGERP